MGTLLLRRLTGFKNSLERVQDVLGLIVLAGLASPVVAASVGVLSLSLAGQVPAHEAPQAWLAWWTGTR